MAITNAQQFKQLVNPPMKGKKRPGYRGVGEYRGGPGGSGGGKGKEAPGSKGSKFEGGQNVGKDSDLDRAREVYQANQTLKLLAEDKAQEPFETLIIKDSNLPGFLGMGLDALKGPRQFMLNKNVDYFRGLKSRGRLNDPNNRYSATAQGYKNYMADRLAGKIDATGNPLNQEDDDNEIFIPQGIMTAQEPEFMNQETKDQDEGLRLAFRADGGRIGFRRGGRRGDTGQASYSESPSFSRPDDSGPSTPPPSVINPPPKEPTGGGGKGPETFQMVNPTFKKSLFEDELRLEKFINKIELENRLKEQEGDQTVQDSLTRGEGIDISNIIRNAPQIKQRISNTVSGIMSNPEIANLGTAKTFKAMGGLADGNFDFESARQMYGLGKLVKKATRAVKKIAKSPIGKAALLYAGTAGLGALGAGAARAGTGFGIFAPSNVLSNLGATKALFTNKLFGDIVAPSMTRTGGLLSKIPGGGVTAGIVGTSLLAGLLTAEQEEEAQELSRGEGIDIEAARQSILARAQGNIGGDLRMLSARASGGRIGYQEGSKEPVAKKTMPLLDMGGQEMDLRAEGGFVPIGRMEKADDVPARLSKNEFVFTADAVRNAGDGDVDKGAEVMYNMMKNLESGGDVSEESQGLEGARKMFQTSQRLEEVL